MKPRIAIPVPWADDIDYSQRSWPEYAAAVTEAGGEPVEVQLSLSEKELQQLATTCDAILLPGSGADIDPARYGHDRIPECNPADPARETADRILLEDAYAHQKPILGICAGLQSLNVFRGGTLVQDLLPSPVNHRAGRAVGAAHTISIAPGSLLASIADPQELSQQNGQHRLQVNSSHHQAVLAAGDGLTTIAQSPEDGVIEALEETGEDGESHFVLGVQWHPERTRTLSPTSRNIFIHLIAEATKWQSAHRESQTAQTT